MDSKNSSAVVSMHRGTSASSIFESALRRAALISGFQRRPGSFDGATWKLLMDPCPSRYAKVYGIRESESSLLLNTSLASNETPQPRRLAIRAAVERRIIGFNVVVCYSYDAEAYGPLTEPSYMTLKKERSYSIKTGFPKKLQTVSVPSQSSRRVSWPSKTTGNPTSSCSHHGEVGECTPFCAAASSNRALPTVHHLVTWHKNKDSPDDAHGPLVCLSPAVGMRPSGLLLSWHLFLESVTHHFTARLVHHHDRNQGLVTSMNYTIGTPCFSSLLDAVIDDVGDTLPANPQRFPKRADQVVAHSHGRRMPFEDPSDIHPLACLQCQYLCLSSTRRILKVTLS